MKKDWDSYFMEFARLAASRSSCLKRQVGAIIVRDNRIITTGYNGPPSGIKHCTKCRRENIESGKLHDKCNAIHAEENAILQAAKIGVSVKDCKLYCLLSPCSRCLRTIINVGIKEVIYEKEYTDPYVSVLIKESGLNYHAI